MRNHLFPLALASFSLLTIEWGLGKAESQGNHTPLVSLLPSHTQGRNLSQWMQELLHRQDTSPPASHILRPVQNHSGCRAFYEGTSCRRGGQLPTQLQTNMQMSEETSEVIWFLHVLKLRPRETMSMGRTQTAFVPELPSLWVLEEALDSETLCYCPVLWSGKSTFLGSNPDSAPYLLGDLEQVS